MDKKTKKEILKEQELMLKIMSYKVGQPASEQLNEGSILSAVKSGYNSTVNTISDVADSVGDALEYVADKAVEGGEAIVDYAVDAGKSTVNWAQGKEGKLPDFLPIIGTKKKTRDAAMVAGAILVAPVLPALTKILCGTDLLPGLVKLYNGLQGSAPPSADDVTDTEKKKLYRFNLRYYSPGKMTSNNGWGIPTGLSPGKQFPVSGHIGVRPDDAKFEKNDRNDSKYWTDWGPGSSGAQQMGNAKSHKFTGSFNGCKVDTSKSCGRGAEGNYYIYLNKAQMQNYFKVQPKFRNKKHGKWPGFKIEAANVDIPSMPNFCDPNGYHIAYNNCADATSQVLGLPTGGGELPDKVAARALAKFPNKNADGESSGASKLAGSIASGVGKGSKPEEEKPKPKPTIRKAWEMNNKGAQQKYKTFEDFEYAARYYQRNGRPPQALEDKPPYSYEK